MTIVQTDMIDARLTVRDLQSRSSVQLASTRAVLLFFLLVLLFSLLATARPRDKCAHGRRETTVSSDYPEGR